MALRGGTVRAYLQAIQRVATIPGATEHTYRAALGEFLIAAAAELGFGQMTVRSELRLADVGQPDLQVVNGDGVAIGYGEGRVTACRPRGGRIPLRVNVPTRRRRAAPGSGLPGSRARTMDDGW